MDYRIRWSDGARGDLERIVRGADRDDPRQAGRLSRGILAAVRRAAQYPHSGRVVPETSLPSVREKAVHGHRLIYELDDLGRRLFVLRICAPAADSRGLSRWCS